MADNPLLWAPRIQAPDANPLMPDVTPEAMAEWRQRLADTWAAMQNPQTWVDAARQYGNAIAMGTTSSGGNMPLAKWFGGSKITDPSGAPLTVYHGTRAPDVIENFDQVAAAKTGRWTNDEGAGQGFHFSEDPEIAAIYGKVGKYHIKMEKPLYVTEDDVARAQNNWLSDLESSGTSEGEQLADFIRQTKAFDNPGSGYYNYGLKLLTDDAKAANHDGIVFRRMRDFGDDRLVNEYIPFEPGQIRRAP